jgi:DNA replicative helicase MCM subunit Mcm2 (Cdc46/Mcm family)
MVDHKEKLKRIIEKMTQKRKSIFSEKVFLEAGEFGIGEMHVRKMIEELMEENYIVEPIKGVLQRRT